MGLISTHVLDMASGRPAAGVRVDLFRVEETPLFLKSAVTNGEGRTDGPLLSGMDLLAGTYQLLFYVGEYYAAAGHQDAGKFLAHVPLVFRVADAQAKYHVPLLVSPWAYSTYRGS